MTGKTSIPKLIAAAILVISVATVKAQTSLRPGEALVAGAVNPNTNKTPIYFIDSVRLKPGKQRIFSNEEVAAITMYKDSAAIAKAGTDAKDGVIYVETPAFVKKRYTALFIAKNPSYAKLAEGFIDEGDIEYILNNKVVEGSLEVTFAPITAQNLKSLRIIGKDQLAKEFGIKDKKYGVVITITEI